MAAIGALRREARARERVTEDVGLLVAADPAQRVHLERPASHVGIEGGEFVTPQIKSDAHPGKLLLQYGGQQARAFVGAGLHREMKAEAARAARFAGFI